MNSRAGLLVSKSPPRLVQLRQRVQQQRQRCSPERPVFKVREELQQRKRPSYKLLSEEELANGLRTIEQEWHAKGGHWIDPKPHILITGVK